MAAERKRPWYLVLALLGALVLGTTGAADGWGRVLLYRTAIDPSVEGEGISDGAERDAVVARARAWLQALDDAEPRGFPLGVGALVLGSGIFVFGMRTLGGNGAARALLVQLLVAQAALQIADYRLLRHMWDLRDRVLLAKEAAIARDHVDPEVLQEDLPVTPVLVGLQTLASALVIFGLTRRRSRQFLEARGEALRER